VKTPEEAARTLRESLSRDWVHAIGVGRRNGKPALMVYVSTKSRAAVVPSEWEGYEVVRRYVGRGGFRPANAKG
jgi:hypothetical protein